MSGESPFIFTARVIGLIGTVKPSLHKCIGLPATQQCELERKLHFYRSSNSHVVMSIKYIALSIPFLSLIKKECIIIYIN
jgi:hypothetical protein